MTPEELINTYREGATLRELAAAENVSSPTIARRLQSYGEPRRSGGRRRKPIPDTFPDILQCSYCGQDKPADEFSPDTNRRGRAYRCRKCDAVRHMAAQYKRYEQTTQLLAVQQGACAICKTKLDLSKNGRGKWALDHCHTFDNIRGVLCSSCNRALGLFKDNPQHMRNAAEYVEKHRECFLTRQAERATAALPGAQP